MSAHETCDKRGTWQARRLASGLSARQAAGLAPWLAAGLRLVSRLASLLRPRAFVNACTRQALQLMGHQSPRRLGDMPYEEMEKWTRWATHVAMLDRYDNMTQVHAICLLALSASAATACSAAC